MQDKVIVGSEEWCSFPALGIPTIKARVDSGAKTSALHAVNIVTFEKDSEKWVKFDINPIQNNVKAVIHCEAPLVDLSMEMQLSGLVATNTTLDRTNLSAISAALSNEIGMGGLSGKPVKEKSTQIVRYLSEQTNGTIPIIASG